MLKIHVFINTITMLYLLVGHHRQNVMIGKLSASIDHLFLKTTDITSLREDNNNFHDHFVIEDEYYKNEGVFESEKINSLFNYTNKEVYQENEWEDTFFKAKDHHSSNNRQTRTLKKRPFEKKTTNYDIFPNNTDKRTKKPEYETNCVQIARDLAIDPNVTRRNLDERNVITNFQISFEVMADNNPEEVSWFLLDSRDDNIIINSTKEHYDVGLSPNSLREFEYQCAVHKNDKTDDFDVSKKFCYDFEVYDSGHNGLCCRHGLGWFKVHLNNNTTPFLSERFYNSAWIGSSFCVNNDGTLTKEEIGKEDVKYYSRDCIKKECVCDSNPTLFLKSGEGIMQHIKTNVLSQVLSLSGTEKFLDVSTPQYKAACWVLNDDPYFALYDNNNIQPTGKIEDRMIQRYILALFYFATTPEQWKHHFHFLSLRSECEWNTWEEFNTNDGTPFTGCLCDDEENIISMTFWGNNLAGTIIEEIYALKKLEQFEIAGSEKLHGTIPSSVARLKNLRSFWILGESAVGGTIPKEIFDVTTMNTLLIGRTEITGTIPANAGNLKRLSNLNLYKNNLSGTIPTGVYSMKGLVYLALNDNNLTSTLSALVGNLKNIEQLWLENNNFFGPIPESIASLPNVQRNKFFGGHRRINLNGNLLTGKIPDELCSKSMVQISSDCRNDVLKPDVYCSCCFFCTDRTPVWDGECADTTLNLEVHHAQRYHPLGYFRGNSDGLKIKLTEERTNMNILQSGPYQRLKNIRPTYKACVTNSGCYKLDMITPPAQNTSFSILWNDKLIYSGNFTNRIGENIDYPQTLINFQYDEVSKEMSTSCKNKQKIVCDTGNIDLQENSIQQIMYSAAIKISGAEKIQDPTSDQSKSLCWILKDQEKKMYDFISSHKEQIKALYDSFIQRYVLTLLHINSTNKIFGGNEFPPNTDECHWRGILCDREKKYVTSIILNNEDQYINGPLIPELGSLVYLKKLKLSNLGLNGNIPESLGNLWSLTKLDLSQNNITGKIPGSFLHQLEKLEYIDLSDNFISGSIPKDIGNYSKIRHLSLGENQLTGSVPLSNFKFFSLEHLDVGENLLSGLEFSSLLNHSNLRVLNLASNFFVSNLPQHTFESLIELQYFNISKNDFFGTIPSRLFKSSRSDTYDSIYHDSHGNPLRITGQQGITHFDASSNRLENTIPTGFGDLSNMEHLNLQGNKLTGSLPSELNNLSKLKVLVLSHNELKGSIPISFDKLSNVQMLHLHSNKLLGQAPETKKELISYITDCGYPSTSGPVLCDTCDKCCNSEGGCQLKHDDSLPPVIATVIFIFVIVGFIILGYSMKDRITSSGMLPKKINSWNGILLLSDKSVYHFLLTRNSIGWCIAFGCGIVQIMILFLFVHAANIENESSDWVYTVTCPSTSLTCEDSKGVTSYGYFIFSLVLSVWLLRDAVSSIKLMLLALERRNIDYLFASGFIFLITMLSAWTSIYYNVAIATKNTELIVNTVILLFVVEMDERLYQLAETCNYKWVKSIEQEMDEKKESHGGDLLLQRSSTKLSSFVRRYHLNFKLPKKYEKNDVGKYDVKKSVTEENDVEKNDVEKNDVEKNEDEPLLKTKKKINKHTVVSHVKHKGRSKGDNVSGVLIPQSDKERLKFTGNKEHVKRNITNQSKNEPEEVINK